jgi:hypothetical protein
MTDRRDAEHQGDDGTAERAAKGLLSMWIVARTTPWIVRLTLWAAWLAAIGAYTGYVWWRVRRALRAEGIDDVGAWLHRADAPQ